MVGPGVLLVVQVLREWLGQDFNGVRAFLHALDDRWMRGVEERLRPDAEIGDLLVAIDPLSPLVAFASWDEARDLEDLGDRLVVVDEPGEFERLLLAGAAGDHS